MGGTKQSYEDFRVNETEQRKSEQCEGRAFYSAGLVSVPTYRPNFTNFREESTLIINVINFHPASVRGMTC